MLGWFVGPEIEPVDVSMGKPESPLMGVVPGLAFYHVHGKGARNGFSGSGPQRVEVWFGSLGANEEVAERLAVDLDRDTVTMLRDLHLRTERQRRCKE